MSGQDEDIFSEAMALEALRVEVRDAVLSAMRSGLSFADCCAAALDASARFDANEDEERDPVWSERVDDLRALARLVDKGEVSALVLAYQLERDSTVFLTLVAHDATLSLARCEDMIDALQARIKEGC